jgi:hypothetical protein
MPSRACLEIKLPNIRPAAVARPFLTLASRTQHQAQGCIASRQAFQSVSGWVRTSRSFNQYRDILLQPNALAYCTETILDVVLYSFGYLRSNLSCNLSILRMHVPIPPVFHLPPSRQAVFQMGNRGKRRLPLSCGPQGLYK